MEGPSYRVRVSQRTRRVHLVVTAAAGLTVVVPPRFDRSKIAPLLASRQDWIERAQRRFAAERSHLAASRAEGPPRQLDLSGLGERWRVRYEPTASPGVTCRQGGDGTLVLRGAVGDEALVSAALCRFVSRRVKAVLGPRLASLAAARRLTLGPLSVRAQRTRWGSCSTRGGISLNRNLAFLPPHLVRHVLLHELCHRREMSHSPAFWRLLDAEEPERQRLEQELRAAWRYLPYWARI